jgi:hypothetical protein
LSIVSSEARGLLIILYQYLQCRLSSRTCFIEIIQLNVLILTDATGHWFV